MPQKVQRHSAGLLAYHLQGGLHLFLAHMGGPFWAHRDTGAWSIPKGEYHHEPDDPGAARVAAAREFAEEIGVPAPAGPWLELGECRQPSGKVITTFAVAADPELAFRASNEFQMEWPRGSGKLVSFPEVDRAAWFPRDLACQKIVPGQVPILTRLADLIG